MLQVLLDRQVMLSNYFTYYLSLKGTGHTEPTVGDSTSGKDGSTRNSDGTCQLSVYREVVFV